MIQADTSKEKTRLDQNRMPFLESLLAERNRWQTSFHMPGHKGRLPLHPMMEDLLGGNPQPADLVEINGILDYLHSPKGALKQSQELAAAAYGADHTFFLINGSTVGNIGAVMSVSSTGQRVIMARASHRSVYSGVVLSGAMPVYIEPEYHPQVGSPLAVRAEVVQQLLNENDHVVAVHITSPNYYGVISDTARIAQITHQQGAVLLVDEAHGSHLNFHEALPESATRLGADMIIQSTHKTQGALTQGSMLHCNDHGLVNLGRVAQVLALLQSSSPSSLLLASLDAARMQMATQGHALLDHVITLAQQAREAIRMIDGLWCYGDELVGTVGVYAYDPTKLIIRTTDAGYTGYEAYDKLRYEHGIDAEFSDLRQVICSVTIGDTEESINKLIKALQAIAAEARPAKKPQAEVAPPAGLPQLVISPREAYFAKSRPVPIQDAVGEVIAENIIPYPPGIPLLVPGEVMEHQHLAYLEYIMKQGSGVVGPEDKSLRKVRVVVQ
ncbi:MAG: arginine decarboxylase [Phototrophicales bacterium]